MTAADYVLSVHSSNSSEPVLFIHLDKSKHIHYGVKIIPHPFLFAGHALYLRMKVEFSIEVE